MKSATGEDYFAVCCDCGVGEDRYMIMGILASRKEALEMKNHPDVQQCVAPHTIKKVKVRITWK